jgi:hypothetical protein
MSCPVCRQRKGRRACPALGSTICSTCCGTKRLVEIDCPADCPHLAAAREHPAAAVRRQQERDVALLMPTVSHLTERQHQLFFLFHTLIARHTPEGFARLVDADVADAASALAATLDTAARGVIYEHAAQSSVARKLASELQTLLMQIREQGATVYDGEAALTLRAIEQGATVYEGEAAIALKAIAQGAREMAARTDGRDVAYLELMSRLMQTNRAARDSARDGAATKPGSSIILP